MSVKKDHTGRRWVEVELEVPGTPEEVWAAVATGPGISSWFVPTEFEAGDDGTPAKVVSHFGPGNSMDSEAAITEWVPPHHFKATSGDLGPDAPEIATEWIVEARSGSTCTVRVVHSLFTDGDEWDKQLEGWESGWPWFFQILRLSLLDFRNQPCRAFRIMGATGGDPAQAHEGFGVAFPVSYVASLRAVDIGGVDPGFRSFLALPWATLYRPFGTEICRLG